MAEAATGGASPGAAPGAGAGQSERGAQALMELQFSFAPTCVLGAALELGLFTHVAAGHDTAEAAARAAGGTVRGTRMVLDALVALGLLDKRPGERYAATPIATRYLVRESPDYMGTSVRLIDAWLRLAEVVRTGKPAVAVESEEKAATFFPDLVRALHVIHREPARRTAAIVTSGLLHRTGRRPQDPLHPAKPGAGPGKGGGASALEGGALGAGAPHRGLRAVDVGAGSGIFGIALAEADPGARVTAQDFAPMLDVTRGYVARHGLADRFDYLPGNLRTVDFGESRFDVALLGNIVHSEGEASSRDLFRRLHRALVPGGWVAIIDMVPADDRRGPPFPLFFAINMLVLTREGDAYTLAEYRRWLEESGFADVRTADMGWHSPLVLATKP